MRTLVCILSALMLTVGCATAFTGEAHVEGGPAGCAAKCQKWGQELVGMVAMGEYSDACICRVPGKNVSLGDASAVAGGASGVWMQTMAAKQTH